jgi:hypothetical protein
MAFVKGKSGNPLGRPTGSRNKLVESFVSDLQEKWRADGKAILDAVEPAKIVEAISRLAPKDLAVTVNERNSLGVDPRLWAGFQRVLAAIEECAPEGMQPVEVFESLEQLVRSHFATQIESKADTLSA